jgi:hypothetical protein
MPRLVCIDCVNRLDMVAVFVESCMRAHHQFLSVQTNDPSKRVAPAIHTDDQDDDDENDDVVIKSEPNGADEDIDLDDQPHVLRSKDNNPRIAQVFSIDPEESNEPVASVFIKAERKKSELNNRYYQFRFYNTFCELKNSNNLFQLLRSTWMNEC